MAKARLDQPLLRRVATHLGKPLQYVREQVSRRASREGVASEVALVNWARELGLGATSAIQRLPASLQQQLSTARVLRPSGSAAMPRQGKRTIRKAGGTARRNRAAEQNWIFVSHAASDKALAEKLLELLRAALNVPADRVICTSVDGYRLAAGVDNETELRKQVLASRVFVGLLTPVSLDSAYVLFELGARWGAELDLIPVMAAGMRPEKLRGPLAGINAMNCDSRAQLFQLVGDVATALGMEAEKPQVFEKHVQRLSRASREAGRAGVAS